MTSSIENSEQPAPSQSRARPCVSPLPSNAFVTYFAHTQSKSPGRPAPASGMMLDDSYPRESPRQSYSKRIAFTSIPRPLSGTSRIATSSGLSSTSRTTADGSSPLNEYSAEDRDEAFVQSYYLSRSLLPRSESLIECLEQADSPKQPSPAYKIGTKPKLVKSYTSTSLGSTERDICIQRCARGSRPALPRFATQVDLTSPKEKRFAEQIAEERFRLSPSLARGASFRDRSLGRQTANVAESHAWRDLDGTPQSKNDPENDGEEVDPRLVYVSEPVQYWLGRYMACHDRMREVNHHFLLKEISSKHSSERRTPSETSNSSSSLDRTEVAIRSRILADLRATCQTQAARNGLDRFEHSMSRFRHESGVPHRHQQPRSVSYGGIMKKDNDLAQNQQSITSRKISSKFRKSSAPASSIQPDLRTKKDRPEIWTVGSTPRITHQRSSSWRLADADRQAFISQQFVQTERKMYDGSLDPHHSQQNMSDPSGDAYSSHGRDVSRHRESMSKPQAIRKKSGLMHSDSVPSVTSRTDRPDCGDTSQQISSTGGIRRFRKSESMKMLVDAGLREIKKIGHLVSHQSGYESPERT